MRRITKKIRGNLSSIYALLDEALNWSPTIEDGKSCADGGDLYAGCETEEDVKEVSDATCYVIELLRKLEYPPQKRRKS